MAARDRTAFVLLFDEYAPRVRGYLGRAIGDSARADDLTQEVLLRVWRRAHTYDPARGEVATWIFTITRSVLVDGLRQERRPEPSEDDEAFVPVAPPRPDRATEAKRREQAVQVALHELPEEQAIVMRSAYFEGKSMSAIADEQRVPVGTIKSRARLAARRLRERLAGESP